MKTIALTVTANQSFTIQLDGHIYDITIRETNGVMSCDITRDDVRILSGCRIVADYPLIPYEYMDAGNFLILTDNGDLPYWTQFDTQVLIYASPEELEAFKNG